MQPFPVIFFLAVIYFMPAFGGIIEKANGTFASRISSSNISVTNGGPWGEWTWVDKCPEGTYAFAFSLKVLENGGMFQDDFSLNGIRLYCTALHGTTYYIESASGEFGRWTPVRKCQRGFLHAFQMKVEPYAVRLDNTAANNIKFRCSTGVTLEERGGPFGDYGRWSDICPKGAICGMQTKLQPYQGAFKDDTGLNDVIFFCCDLTFP